MSPGDAEGRAGAAPRIVWERLRLEGFGRHADVRVALPPALGVWVAPNEAGKTTAILGLVAVLWGLPHLQDAAAFSWARFRSWGGGAHRGAVTLRAGDARFTVQRAFDTHRVRVVAHEAGGDRLIVDADHNPNARRETSAYAPWLRTTLGLTEADVVLATFVVAQGDLGGPRHALGGDVQALLAGAGGGGWAGARARLEEALRVRTRRLRAQGAGFARDGTVDRALEVAEARVAALEAALEGGRAAADAFERAQLEVRAAVAARRAAQEGRDRWSEAVAAQHAWVERREANARALARRTELAAAAAAARERVAAAQAARAAATAHDDLHGVGAAFDGAGSATGERLDAWVDAARAAAHADARWLQARGARGAAVGVAHDAVAAALAKERAVPTPARDWRAWVEAADVGEGGAVSVEEAVAEARAACGRWSTALATARAACARLAAVDAARAPLAAFERFDANHATDVRGYAARRDAWAERLAEAEEARAAAFARVDAHAQRFDPVRALAPELAAALRAFADAHERPDGSAAWRWLGALGWVAVVGWGAPPLGAAFDLDVGPVVAWGAGVAAALAWWWALPRHPARRRARRALARFAAGGSLEAAALAVGRSADDDDARFELARRLEAYDALGADVVRDEAELVALEERLAALRAGADAFDHRWAPWRQALVAAGAPADVDLGAAHAEWTRLAGERAVALERVRAAATALGLDPDVAPGTLHERVAADASARQAGRDGARVAAWARFQGGVDGDDARVGEVEGWLARVAVATWARWAEEAARADALAERRRVAAADRVAAEADASRVAAEHERAVQHEEERAATSASAARAARAALAEALGPGGAAALAAWGDDAEAARGAWRAHRAAHAAADAAAAEARAHLAALGVEVEVGGDGAATLAALRAGAAAAERRAEAAAIEAGVRLTAWRELVAAHPDLPPVDAADAAPDPAKATGAGAAFADARAALAAAANEVTAADERALAAREALARLQGSDPIDVAVAELDLVEARQEALRLRGERDALALALRTLDAAVDEYRGAHAARLEAAATRYFATFSGVEGRRVVLDPGFAAHVVEPSGDEALPAQLSQGARDQLAVALRLAVADLLAADVRLPLVFDDPFLNWDEVRAERLAAALRALARERQVIVLTHRPALAAWGEALVVESG